MLHSVVIPEGLVPGETWKAREHRLRTGWFDKYAPSDKSGIDIGCQKDFLNTTFRRWDLIFGDGDATYMDGVEDNSYHTVYCSHILEHLEYPVLAIKNWYRITKPGGHLIILVPHRDMYEKKESPPSKWNQEHKWFFLPYRDPHQSIVAPSVLFLNSCILEAIPDADIVSYEVLSEGYIESPPHVHSCGEYSIEAVVRKRVT